MRISLARWCLVAAAVASLSGCYSGGRWTMPNLAFWKHNPFDSVASSEDPADATPKPSELAAEPGPEPGAGYESADMGSPAATTMPDYPSTAATTDAPSYTAAPPAAYTAQQSQRSSATAPRDDPAVGAGYVAPQQGRYAGAPPAQPEYTQPSAGRDGGYGGNPVAPSGAPQAQGRPQGYASSSGQTAPTGRQYGRSAGQHGDSGRYGPYAAPQYGAGSGQGRYASPAGQYEPAGNRYAAGTGHDGSSGYNPAGAVTGQVPSGAGSGRYGTGRTGYTAAPTAGAYGNPVRQEGSPEDFRRQQVRTVDHRYRAGGDDRRENDRWGGEYRSSAGERQDFGPADGNGDSSGDPDNRYRRTAPNGQPSDGTPPGDDRYQPPESSYQPGRTGYQPPADTPSYQPPSGSWDTPSGSAPADGGGYMPGSVERYQP